MADVEIKNWRGKDIDKLVQLEMQKRLNACGILLKNEMKIDVSEPSPPASAPGDAPHKDTGRLRASIAHQVDAETLSCRVGSNLLYAKFLELGTRFMAARPFIRKAYYEHLPKLMKILGG